MGAAQGSRATYRTRPTLLARLRSPEDHEAWEAFYRFYAGLIFHFLGARGCPRQLAEEVLQETLVTLVQHLPGFRYDPAVGKFRSFLLRTVHCRFLDALRREAKQRPPGPNTPDEDADRVIARETWDASAFATQEAWDAQWERSVLAEALERVKRRTSAATFSAFAMMALEERPPAEVSRLLGLAPNTVHQIKNRVTRMLLDEARAVRLELGDLA